MYAARLSVGNRQLGLITMMFDRANAPDPDQVYSNYLKTCRMAGIEPVPRERALGLVQEWTERLSGRPEPTEE